MKGYIAAFLALVLLSSGAIVSAGAAVGASRDRVEVREELLMGDRSGAEGIELDISFSVGGRRLGWETRVALGEEELRPETRAEYRPDGPGEVPIPSRVTMGLSDMSQSVYGLGLDGTEARTLAARHFVLDVKSRTEPGTIRTEVLPAEKFLDAMPWHVYIIGFQRGISVSDATEAKLEKLFRVPVDGVYLAVTVEKDAGGSVVGYSVTPVSGPGETQVRETDTGELGRDSMDFSGGWAGTVGLGEWPFKRGDMEALAGEDRVWVCPSVRDSEGREVVEFRDGPGIYMIPARGEYGELDPDRAELFYSTDALPMYLRMSPDGERIELYAIDGGRLTLAVLDRETGEELEVLDLMAAPDDSFNMLDRGELKLIWGNGGDLVLIEDRDATTPVLRGRLEAQWTGGEWGFWTDRLFWDFSTTALAWDGERMALTNWTQRALLVMDGTGVRYLARFDLSPLWSGDLLPDSVPSLSESEKMPLRAVFTGGRE